MSNQLQGLKEELNIDAMLVADNKGFEIYNSGFSQTHHLHALKQLSRYFFPGQENTVIGIETDQFTVVIKDSPEGNLVATRELK